MRRQPCANAVAAQQAVAFIDDGRPMLQQAEIAAPAAGPFQKFLADRRLRQRNRQCVADEIRIEIAFMGFEIGDEPIVRLFGVQFP